MSVTIQIPEKPRSVKTPENSRSVKIPMPESAESKSGKEALTPQRMASVAGYLKNCFYINSGCCWRFGSKMGGFSTISVQVGWASDDTSSSTIELTDPIFT